MKGTPVYKQLQRIAKHVIPLNLVNPEAPEFTPSACKTQHDLARFCHEYFYREMLQISDLASMFHGWSLKLDAALPMDIHLIDLGNGLKEDSAESNTVKEAPLTPPGKTEGSGPFLLSLTRKDSRSRSRATRWTRNSRNIPNPILRAGWISSVGF